MKAIVITAAGGPEVLHIQERPVPQPAEDEVLIKIIAAGVNRPDVFQRKGRYPAPPGAPVDIPGLEVSGIIEKTGSSVQRWKQGDAVCALLSGGGYAEYVTAPAGQCLPVPSGWRIEDAASLPETVFTVWHNVFQRGKLLPGEIFLVHGGSSGIGITAIQLAKAIGATVYTTAGSEEKCDACLQLGADRSINYHKQDFEEALKDTGVDLVLDMIGGDYVPKNLRLLRADGRLVFINAMKGNTLEADIHALMSKRITITGSTLRARDTAFKSALTRKIEEKVWPILTAGKFKPVIDKTFPLKDAAAAHTLMESSGHVGKILLVNGG